MHSRVEKLFVSGVGAIFKVGCFPFTKTVLIPQGVQSRAGGFTIFSNQWVQDSMDAQEKGFKKYFDEVRQPHDPFRRHREP
jgi:hypothetical protein